MELKDGDVVLRSFRKDDVGPVAVYCNNKKVWDNVRDSLPHPYTEADAEAFIGACAEEALQMTFAVEYKGAFVGCIGLVPQADVYRLSAEVGYWLGEPFWGLGIATRAVRLITAYGFEQLGMERIFTGVFDFNKASQRVLEKAGFTLEAVLPKAVIKNDQLRDECLYGLVKAKAEVPEKPTGLTQTAPRQSVLWLVVTVLLAGVLVKLPEIGGFTAEKVHFYERNLGLLVLLALSAYAYLTAAVVNVRQLLITLGVFAVSGVYVNLLPAVGEGYSTILAYMHLPLMLWCLYGLVFTDYDLRNKAGRMAYIRHNGDLALVMGVLLLTGGALTGLTMMLFSAIDLKVETFFGDYVILPGLVAVPVVATYVLRGYPRVTQKLASVVARLVSPFLLVVLLAFLVGMLLTERDPFNDRDFLVGLNALLLVVVAVVVFALTESSAGVRQRFNELTMFLLVVAALLINLVTLSAIVYRLAEFGFTPNRTAILGSNLVLLGNLVWLVIDLYRVNVRKAPLETVERSIAGYLPVYALWTVFVVFVLPALFGFR